MQSAPDAIARLFDAARESVGQLLRLRQQEVDMALADPDTPSPEGWRGLEAAIAALLKKASDTCDDGATIAVSAERVEANLIVRILSPGDHAGRGRPLEIFDHLDDENRRGLELTAARTLVERLGGHVVADSPGEGLRLRVTLTLPLA